MEIMLHIIPRQVAIERGFVRYFTGKPCGGGHLLPRLTSSKKCPQCQRDYQREVNSAPEKKAKRAEYDRQRLKKNPGYLLEKGRRYYVENRDAVNAQKRDYWTKNKDKMKAARARWAAENAHVIRHLNATRKAHIKRATPPWADMEAIKAVYAEADRLTLETGVAHHVDHIVPIKGEMVSGLHVHWNLRPLPWRENISKKNKFEILS